MSLTRGGNLRGRGGFIKVCTSKRVAKQIENFLNTPFRESAVPILHVIPERLLSFMEGIYTTPPGCGTPTTDCTIGIFHP